MEGGAMVDEGLMAPWGQPTEQVGVEHKVETESR